MKLHPPARLRPRGLVLLAAGAGSRMRPLTDEVPKALLPVGDRTAIDWMVDAMVERSAAEIVVVAGHAAPRVREHLRERYGSRVATVVNERWATDTNIGSVDVGVEALQRPERGYLIAETDLLLDDAAWDQLFDRLADDDASMWVTRGQYGPTLTGGTVHARPGGRIDAVDYRPRHDSACDGWPKMLGMLAVGPGQVAADRLLRRKAMAMAGGLQQYYLEPWRRHLPLLPCRVLALGAGWAATYNTAAEFEAARRTFLERMAVPA